MIYRISEFAEKCGVNKETIRYYERKNLLQLWQQNNSRQRLREITKSLKSETLRSLVCMLVLATTEITKIHGI